MSADAAQLLVRGLALRPAPFRRRGWRAGLCGIAAILSAIAALVVTPAAHAQGTPKIVIDQDCSAFSISSNNKIAYAVPRRKFIKKYILERDDIFIASPNGKIIRIVDADKFIPFPPVEGFVVHSIAWSPDGSRLAVNMTLQPLPARLEEQIEEKNDKHKKKKKRDESDDDDSGDSAPVKPAPGGSVVALFRADGQPIQVAGAKSQFVQHATNAAWLADDQSVVYMSGAQIVRLQPADGSTTKLFEGHAFQAVAWDPPRNRAFAVGEDITVYGGLALVELDLLHQTVRPLAKLASYKSSLTVSPSGKNVGFFADGDTIEAIDVDNPSKTLRVHAGLGVFQWGQSENRVLLKRGPESQSNDLVWVGLQDDSFVPALRDLEFRAFQIAPDGNSLAVTEPGKRVLKVFPLE
jgi:hypothetical protein